MAKPKKMAKKTAQKTDSMTFILVVIFALLSVAFLAVVYFKSAAM